MRYFNEPSKNLKLYTIMKEIKLKKLFSLVIIFLLITSTLLIFIPKIEAQKRFSGSGSGTPWDPYVITNVKQLQEMKYDLRAHYVLGNDIDASETKYWNDGRGFEPIGDRIIPFSGSFDGRGYKIYNLYINTTRGYVGLFGYVGKEGIIKNVGLENVKISSKGDDVGGLIGFNYGIVSNSYSTGTVNGLSAVGGLVGHNDGKISNSYSAGYVNGMHDVGGLVGHNGGTVSNCYSRASVNGEENVGGLVGSNHLGKVLNSYSTGSVKGHEHVGGLVGRNEGTVSNSFWDIETSGLKTSDGGTGKTTAEMKNVRTYTDLTWSKGLESPWDFVGNPYNDKGNEDVWDIKPNINDGYPYLVAIIFPPTPQTPAALTPAAIPLNIELIIIIIVIVAILASLVIVIRKYKIKK